MKRVLRSSFKVIVIVMLPFLAVLLLLRPTVVMGGIYEADGETTYKEYWISHRWFQGKCEPIFDDENNIIGYEPSAPFGTWYYEPTGYWSSDCPPVDMEFNIPDDLSKANKAEIYLDLWRNHDNPSVRFAFNGAPQTEGYNPGVGLEWSRTPYVGPIDLSDLQQGGNTIKVWKEGNAFHLHDIAIRVYYNQNQVRPDLKPPTGQLLTVQDDNGTYNLKNSITDTLWIDNDQLVLSANVNGDAEFVEFHAYYQGYDLDNDGVFREWQNRGRNNWHPGGKPKDPPPHPELGGTIDHIGTIAVGSTGTYSITWDIPYLPAQSGVKFKIRVVDEDGNVRDAAGGVSDEFILKRSKPVVAFFIPGFEDNILHNSSESEPAPGFFDELTWSIDLPPDISNFDEAYLIGSHWNNPKIKINDSGTLYDAFEEGEDDWTLSIRPINIQHLDPGTNDITYIHRYGYGEFIEKPGPMVVLKQTTPVAGPDTTAPLVHRHSPVPGSVYVEPSVKVTADIFDAHSGVNQNTIQMAINGTPVNPQITGSPFNYTLTYDPEPDFTPGQTVNVSITACDLEGNCLSSPDTFSFSIKPPLVPSTFQSDDFNGCELDTNVWSFQDAVGDATYEQYGDQVFLSVPAGTQHDAFGGNTITAPYIEQDVNDAPEFDIEIKFDSELSDHIQVQGILIKQDNDNYLRFNFQSQDDEIRVLGLLIENQTPNQKFQQWLSLEDGAPPYLRVVRQGLKWTVFYSYGEGGGWAKAGSFEHQIVVDKIGAFVGNAAGNPAHTAVIDYFFNNQSPIDPEDGEAYLLPVTIEGQGEVDKDPMCGNPVTLMATAELGWSFDSWSGSPLDGVTEPMTTTQFARGDAVTALFTRDEYNLDINIVSDGIGAGGSVEKDPLLPFYYYSDTVNLTAVPELGWTFTGWEGANLSGQEFTKTLTMYQSETVTATFTQDHYELQLDIEGPGTVDVTSTSQEEYYLYGDTLTLTAEIVDPEWYFGYWEGDISGSDNPLVLTVTDDLQITAVFTDNPPPILEPIGDKSIPFGQELAFTVTATDPDGTIPTLSVEGLPKGASFSDNGDGTGSFAWTPGPFDSGVYSLTFTASDGRLDDSETITINGSWQTVLLPLAQKGP